jgi:hypothetical protein
MQQPKNKRIMQRIAIAAVLMLAVVIGALIALSIFFALVRRRPDFQIAPPAVASVFLGVVAPSKQGPARPAVRVSCMLTPGVDSPRSPCSA